MSAWPWPPREPSHHHRRLLLSLASVGFAIALLASLVGLFLPAP